MLKLSKVSGAFCGILESFFNVFIAVSFFIITMALRKEVSAKERLVCDIINYKNESLPNKTFYESSFWHKCQKILLLSYYHAKKEKDDETAPTQKRDMYVDHFALIEGFPEGNINKNR